MCSQEVTPCGSLKEFIKLHHTVKQDKINRSSFEFNQTFFLQPSFSHELRLWTPPGSTNTGQEGRAPGPAAHKSSDPLEGRRMKTELGVRRRTLSK